MDKYRGGQRGEIGAALAVVGLSAERVAKEAAIRDDMIRVADRAGASLRQLAEVSGLDRKTDRRRFQFPDVDERVEIRCTSRGR